jgi:hypothetical protein
MIPFVQFLDSVESISTSNVLKTLKNPSLVPRQLSSRPVTANQEIGWYAQNYVVQIVTIEYLQAETKLRCEVR